MTNCNSWNAEVEIVAYITATSYYLFCFFSLSFCFRLYSLVPPFFPRLSLSPCRAMPHYVTQRYCYCCTLSTSCSPAALRTSSPCLRGFGAFPRDDFRASKNKKLWPHQLVVSYWLENWNRAPAGQVDSCTFHEGAPPPFPSHCREISRSLSLLFCASSPNFLEYWAH